MIATTLVDEIRRLLQEGQLSQRKIAARMGVSRGTVNAIAQGKRTDRIPRWQKDGGDFTPPAGLYVRCPTCGGMVQMPCLLCYLRAKANQSTAASKPSPFQANSARIGTVKRAATSRRFVAKLASSAEGAGG